MFLDFLNLQCEVFGLDISDLSLKLVKLEKRQGNFSLVSFGEAVIASGIIKKGEIQDEKALIKIIRQALTKIKGEKLKTNYVVASLPEEKAFLQVIKLPKMKEEEVKKAVYFEAENYIPLPVSEVCLDSQIIPKVSNHRNKIDVLIAALPKQTVNSYLNALKKAGLKPLSFEIESQAISRALVKNNVAQKPLLLIDIGSTRTSFILYFGHSVIFTSSVQISSQKFTEVIAQKFGISFKKAETIKIKEGIKGEKEGKKILQAINPDLTSLVEEIKKCLDYCQANCNKPVEKILLCGGGANLSGLDDFFSAQLKIIVELGNPWVNISTQPLKKGAGLSKQESMRYTTALGLALSGFKL